MEFCSSFSFVIHSLLNFYMKSFFPPPNLITHVVSPMPSEAESLTRWKTKQLTNHHFWAECIRKWWFPPGRIHHHHLHSLTTTRTPRASRLKNNHQHRSARESFYVLFITWINFLIIISPCLAFIHPSIPPSQALHTRKKKTKQNSRTFCFMIFTHILSFSFWRLTGSERPTTGFVTKEITSGESSCFDIACRNTSCCIDLATCNFVTSFEQ